MTLLLTWHMLFGCRRQIFDIADLLMLLVTTRFVACSANKFWLFFSSIYKFATCMMSVTILSCRWQIVTIRSWLSPNFERSELLFSWFNPTTNNLIFSHGRVIFWRFSKWFWWFWRKTTIWAFEDLKIYWNFLILEDLSNFPVIQYSIRTFMNVHEWSETSINTVDRRRLR